MATENELLTEIVDLLEEIEESSSENYSSISGVSGTVDDDTPLTRAANANSVKVVVSNAGPDKCYVKEGGQIVHILDPFEEWISPLKGLLAIEVSTDTDETAGATITTYVK